jgi:chemotaxis protein MotB
MTSYLDLMTLLFAFFVLLVSMSEIRTERVPIITVEDAMGSPNGAETVTVIASGTGTEGGLLPGGTGVLPEFNAVLPGQTGATVSDTSDRAGSAPLADNYNAQFGDLENSFNALSLQGVDATPGTEGLTLRIADNLLFASGQAELMNEGMMLIGQLTEILQQFPGEISVEGHTDNIPINTARFPSNWELSSARAISVLLFLEQEGIADTRMRAIGYADTRPLQSNETAAGRSGNRRVELILRQP